MDVCALTWGGEFASMGAMRIHGVIWTFCVAAQVAMGLTEMELGLLCPSGAGQKKAAALRARLKSMDKGVNAADAKGKTLLMLAAEQDNRVAVCYLVARGADVTAKDKAGKRAQDYTHSASLRELLEACARLGAGGGPAVSHEQRERQALQMGLTTPEARQERLFRLAERPGMYEEINEIIRLGADVNQPGPNGRTLEGVPGLTPEYLAYFVCRGYVLLPASEGQSSPFSGELAAPMGRLLLALGVRPAQADKEGMLWAALFGDDAGEVKELLSDNEGLIRTRTKDGRSLLAQAQSAAMVQALIAAGADAKEPGLLAGILSRSAADPRDAGVLGELLAAGAELPKDALLSFCKIGSGDAGVVKALLKAGADPKAKDDEGNTLLHLLMLNKHAAASAADSCKALLKAGANPKAKNNGGRSALTFAKDIGREDLAKILSKTSPK